MIVLAPQFYDELASRLFVLLEKRLETASKASNVSTDTDTLYTATEAAKKLKLCSKTVLNRIDKGLLPATNLGTLERPQWRISSADLNAFRIAHTPNRKR